MAESQYLTVSDIAAKLGLSKMTIYRMIKDKELSAYRIGRSFRVSVGQFEEFVKNSATSAS